MATRDIHLLPATARKKGPTPLFSCGLSPLLFAAKSLQRLLLVGAVLAGSALLISGTGCAIVDNGVAAAGEVDVHTTGTHVVIQNGTEDRLYYFVLGRNISALLNWVPHLDDERSIAPGRSASVSYEEILMDSAHGETQVIAYWWFAGERDGKRVPVDMDSRIVDL